MNWPGLRSKERWEEAAGLSPVDFGRRYRRLLSASGFLRARGDEISAQFLDDYADWLEGNLDTWCATTTEFWSRREAALRARVSASTGRCASDCAAAR
jgi:glucoamylase